MKERQDLVRKSSLDFQIIQTLPVYFHYHGYQRIDHGAQIQIILPSFLNNRLALKSIVKIHMIITAQTKLF